MNKKIVNAALISSIIYEMFRILSSSVRIWGYIRAVKFNDLITSSDATVRIIRYSAVSSLAEIAVCIVLIVLSVKAYDSVNKQTEQ